MCQKVNKSFRFSLKDIVITLFVLPALVLLFEHAVYAQMFPLGAQSFVFPLLGPKVSSAYGMRRHPILKRFKKNHTGVDLAAPEYAHVRAISAGLVVFADEYKGYGKLVTISHGDGFTSSYGHLDEIRVNPGQAVTAGEIIGRLGSTGMSTGPHLHFEWRKDGKPLDPLKTFPSLAQEAKG